MNEVSIRVATLFTFGPFDISVSLATSVGMTVVISGVGWLLVRSPASTPGPRQVVIEAIVSTMEEAVAQVAGSHAQRIMPFIASIWIFLVCSNLLGLVPGLDSPTRDLSVTTALAIVVFLSVHWFGIRTQGLKKYLQHYLSPSPFLLPFHLISEVTRTVALAVRLFGNMMSLEMAAFLVLMVAGFLVPIPILMLHIVEALVQAYIFGMLALIYVAGGIQSHEEGKP
ncbi:F0F1 ATP synthase subunit A [Desulfopila aestuarii]|uniref:ATP synthase subunit a n=1 Tax=Desulfopila aestuarii DSM 18488 TaxID=1121416 RepID=A0A1M7YAJ8_9BACT|nr:F0F1 ATP synthase subunit A [Desulfopila aestuarii]SHO49611.1 F-type H+-transporting ATPase subunit a [Desulfopila aestuarii DSM 18488]